jgi:3',5'-cyclic AMP phosphodiesterase CpdA
MHSILHLSDLHFTGAESATLWHSQLSEDLKYELDCDHLDAMIVSGDVGTYSLEQEYDEARRFLERLAKEFKLPSDGLIIVPGNHDLNWKLAKKGYSLVDRDECEGDLATARFVEVGSQNYMP